MSVIVRFAPSPTGYLHIGSARTALFNWLYARHHNGKFLLRIEDTDRARSTPEAVKAIFGSLEWLGLNGDEEPVFQFARAERHAQVAQQLLAEGKAYYCYCTTQELEQMREQAKANGQPPRYDGRWRDRDPQEAPVGVKPVIRFKAPLTGETIINDHVQGTVKLDNSQLDDMVLLRADGTPTYMLSVVVDDHDMNITHIIRGDDHLTNAFRQWHLYQACGWKVPEFAHIPLIHGADGAKLSKRHGALGTENYRDMGFLPEAMRNYLLRLGWAHGDDEIIPTEQAVEWFDLPAIGRSPSRFDVVKLTHLNAYYLKNTDNPQLVELIKPFLVQKGYVLTDVIEKRLAQGMTGLKERAKTLVELADNCLFYFDVQPFDEKAQAIQTSKNQEYVQYLSKKFSEAKDFNPPSIEQAIRDAAIELEIKLSELAQALRVALTGRTVSPSLFDIIDILGRDETLQRLKGFC